MVVNYPGKTFVRLFITVAVFFGIGYGSVALIRHITGDDKPKIVATNFISYDLSRAIAKDKAKIKMTVPADINFHDFSPSNQDIEDVKKADLIVYFGGESEEWVDKIVKENNIPEAKYVRILDYLDLSGEENEADEEEEDEEGSEVTDSTEEEKVEWLDHTGEDEHIWTNPLSMIDLTYVVYDAIASIMPESLQDEISNNTDEYMDKWDELSEQLDEAITSDKKAVVADRFPYYYLFDGFGVKYLSLGLDCTKDSKADEQKISELNKYVKENNISTVFRTELGLDELAEKVTKDTNAKVVELYSGHMVSKEDFESGKTYAELYENNIEALKEALK